MIGQALGVHVTQVLADRGHLFLGGHHGGGGGELRLGKLLLRAIGLALRLADLLHALGLFLVALALPLTRIDLQLEVALVALLGLFGCLLFLLGGRLLHLHAQLFVGEGLLFGLGRGLGRADIIAADPGQSGGAAETLLIALADGELLGGSIAQADTLDHGAGGDIAKGRDALRGLRRLLPMRGYEGGGLFRDGKAGADADAGEHAAENVASGKFAADLAEEAVAFFEIAGETTGALAHALWRERLAGASCLVDRFLGAEQLLESRRALAGGLAHGAEAGGDRAVGLLSLGDLGGLDFLEHAGAVAGALGHALAHVARGGHAGLGRGAEGGGVHLQDGAKGGGKSHGGERSGGWRSGGGGALGGEEGVDLGQALGAEALGGGVIGGGALGAALVEHFEVLPQAAEREGEDLRLGPSGLAGHRDDDAGQPVGAGLALRGGLAGDGIERAGRGAVGEVPLDILHRLREVGEIFRRGLGGAQRRAGEEAEQARARAVHEVARAALGDEAIPGLGLGIRPPGVEQPEEPP